MKKLLRTFGAGTIILIVVVLGTLHAVGYRDAKARVEDYVRSFGNNGVPGAIEPYGMNRLLKTTRVRYNNTVYRLSFSSTSASKDEVIDAYSQYLEGPKLVEVAGKGAVKTLFNFDGNAITVIRAMDLGERGSGSFVQKLYTVKKNLGRNLTPEEMLASMPELAPTIEAVSDEKLTMSERIQLGLKLLKTMFPLENHPSKSRIARMPEKDAPGYDLFDESRYPGAVRRSSMALEDGRIHIVRYVTRSTPDAVQRYYLQSLPAAGWAPDPTLVMAQAKNGSSDPYQLLFQKTGGETLNITIAPSSKGQRTDITVMYQ